MTEESDSTVVGVGDDDDFDISMLKDDDSLGLDE